jgi:hypothetical protein
MWIVGAVALIIYWNIEVFRGKISAAAFFYAKGSKKTAGKNVAGLRIK